jgi:UPF0176 protein
MKALHNRVNRELLKERVTRESRPRTTFSFYKYAMIGNVRLFRDHLYLLLSSIDVLGRIYVAHEGINGQISVPSDELEMLRHKLDDITFLKGCRLNKAVEEGISFYKLAIKIRAKIVADGLTDEKFDVSQNARHISAKEYNDLTARPDTIVIDMRNHYESEVGHFNGAITPDVETFRESLPIIENILNENEGKNVVMYCTGGIRCEKATAYFRYRGFENLYQLDGGIIEYARQAKEQGLENKFIGKNFVFDDRLGERISKDIIAQCHQCGAPCDDHTNCANDQCHILFIQCPSCRDEYQGTCSQLCHDFNTLSADEKEEKKGTLTFNGTKFGKGRYKAARKDGLEV